MIISAIIELVVFSVPSGVYVTLLARRQGRRAAARAVGLVPGRAIGYLWAVGVLVVTLGLGYAGIRAAGTVVSRGSNPGDVPGVAALVGSQPGVAGALAVVITTLAEEMLFRGFLVGVLAGRLTFPVWNVVQAALFTSLHAFVLLVSTSLWPILPMQFIGGLLLGWLRHHSRSIGPGWLAHAGGNLLIPVLLGI